MLIDQGRGPALVLIPGIQGRWEYMRPAIDALSAQYRVITFPLCGERRSKHPYDPQRGFDNYVEQTAAVLAEKRIDRAVLCGVSFGGVVALQFAAAFPERTAALILASTPAPMWHLRRRHEIYTRVPWIFGPVFLAESPWRLRAEIAAALPDGRERRAFKRRLLRTLVASPLSVTRMAARAKLMNGMDFRAECARITAPTLVVTGEAGLDHVVRVDESIDYARLIPNARTMVLERTGHLGSITRPHAFAAIVKAFLASANEHDALATRSAVEREIVGTR